MFQKKTVPRSQEYAESIINTMREPLIALDQNLRVVSASRSFYEVFKVKPEETVGQLIYDLGNKQWDIPKLRELLEGILPQKTTFNDYEVEHNFATIGRRIMLLNARQIERRMGKKRIILLAIEDITERKRLQEESEASEEHYRSTFETSHDGLLLVHRSKGDILNANPYAQELLGYSKEEFLKNKIWGISVVKDDKDFQEALSRLESDGVIYYDNISVKNKAGLNVNTEVILVDKVKFIQCNIRDNTERKRAEEALKKSEEKYRSIFENVQDVYYETLFDGMILEVSPSVEFISKGQYKRTDLIGKSIYEFYADIKDRDALMKAIQKTGSVSDFEVSLKIRDGSYIPCSISAKMALNAEGQPEKIVGSMHDIAERKQAEERLRQSEERFRLIAENAADLIAVLDLEGKRIYSSPSYKSILGDPESLRGTDSFQEIHPEDREKIRRIFLETVRTGIGQRAEYRFLLEDGSVRYIESQGSVIRDENGNTINVVVVSREVTERKQAEEALRENEERYMTFFSTSRDCVFITSVDGNWIDLNDAAVELFGYSSREELMQVKISSLYVNAEDRVKHISIIEKRGYTKDYPVDLRKKDGMIIHTLITSAVRHDAENHVTGFMGTIRDITERVRAEEELKKSEGKFRTIFDNTSDGMFLVDLTTRKFFICNAMCVKMLGYTQEEFLTLDIDDIHPSDDLPFINEQIGKFSRGEEGLRSDIRFKRKDGSIFFADLRPAILTIAEKKYLLINFNDITERKQMEEGLRQMQKLEGLGTLAGGIAHDFNNILGIILAYITNTKRFKDDTKKLDLAVDTIVKAVERGKTLVQSILTFARKTETEFGAVNVNDVVMEIVNMIYEMFPKTVTCSQNFDKSIPYINADRSQLYQVLMNLCVNARDAMPKGGVLSINTRMLSIASLRNQHPDATASSYVCIEVSDTGEGMTEEIQKHIFEPFFTTKGVGKGTGLGLAVVFGIIQAHKGFIDVESELGKGTTFRLYLPVSQVVEQVSTKQKEETLEEIPGGSETLLVVEDEEMLMMSLRMVLVEKGYNVLSAGDGQKALKIYKHKKNNINLVLTDLGLPTISGLDVCQGIMKINPKERVILATGFLDPDMKSEFLSAGIQHFLYKPYDLTKVLKMVREVLDEKE